MKLSGGRISEYGSHKISWMQWVAGDIVSVYGKAASVGQPLRELGVDDTDSAIFAFDQGYGDLELTMSPTIAVPSRNMGIMGTRGGAQLVDGKRIIVRDLDQTESEEIIPHPAPSMHQHFFDCIEKDRQPIVDGPSARQTLAACLAFLKSAETGECVKLADLG